MARNPPQGLETLGSKVSKQSAVYMEFPGAVQDAYCEVVEGRVSSELGCSNLFQPTGVKQFKCGTCKFLVPDKEA